MRPSLRVYKLTAVYSWNISNTFQVVERLPRSMVYLSTQNKERSTLACNVYQLVDRVQEQSEVVVELLIVFAETMHLQVSPKFAAVRTIRTNKFGFSAAFVFAVLIESTLVRVRTTAIVADKRLSCKR